MVLPLFALSLVTSALKSGHTNTVAFGMALSISGLNLNLDSDVETIVTSQSSLGDALRGWMLGTTAHLTLVQRVSAVLWSLEVGIVTCIRHSIGDAI